jgi:hypothetical protein
VLPDDGMQVLEVLAHPVGIRDQVNLVAERHGAGRCGGPDPS